ncbi:ras-related protein rab-37 [Anaeramoeba flamelloides]|uniref:Ras-related protein rab-37 n=1 Tax=Anaeramoeba flamelloides TaxID=1746091 RepID=A0ABQ8Y238_9EUKA|nr:ras-related protein rab-37 [Anaeramoeba flamelloides]
MGSSQTKKNEQRKNQNKVNPKDQNNKKQMKYLNQDDFFEKSIPNFLDHRLKIQKHLLKIIFVGDQSCGKSCLLEKFYRNTFFENYRPTIGIDFKTLNYTFWDQMFTLQIWDLGGDSRYKNINLAYYCKSDAVILIFDISNKYSFAKIEENIQSVYKFAPRDVSILLVGTKCDLEEKREVSIQEIQDFVEKYKLYYLETSAKNGTNVKLMFQIQVAQLIDKWRVEKYPEYKSYNLTPTLIQKIHISSYVKDFQMIYNQGEFTDYEIKGIKVHKAVVEARIKKPIEDIKLVLNRYNENEIKLFFDWVYELNCFNLNKTLIHTICQKLGIFNFQKKKFIEDLSKLYEANKTKDFCILAKNTDNNFKEVELKVKLEKGGEEEDGDDNDQDDEDDIGDEDEDDEDEDSENGIGGEEIPKIPVHKIILIARSGLFRNLFKSMKESLNQVSDYSNRSKDTLECLIEFLYTDKITFTSDMNSELIIKELEGAVDFYQLNEKSKLIKILNKYNEKKKKNEN